MMLLATPYWIHSDEDRTVHPAGKATGTSEDAVSLKRVIFWPVRLVWYKVPQFSLKIVVFLATYMVTFVVFEKIEPAERKTIEKSPLSATY